LRDVVPVEVVLDGDIKEKSHMGIGDAVIHGAPFLA
jgi:hypothetical protein